MKSCPASFISLLVMVSVHSSLQQQETEPDPLCVAMTPPCTGGFECRVEKVCTQPDTCELKPTCVHKTLKTGHRGICRIGDTILQRQEGVIADLSCGVTLPCPSGSYCSQELTDTYSFCCRSNPTNLVKSGQCPAQSNIDRSCCLDSCGNDGDCDYGFKCCKDGGKKDCVPIVKPDPCANKVCPRGSFCRKPNDICLNQSDCQPEGNCISCGELKCSANCPSETVTDPDGCPTCQCTPPPVPSQPHQSLKMKRQ